MPAIKLKHLQYKAPAALEASAVFFFALRVASGLAETKEEAKAIDATTKDDVTFISDL